MRGRLTGPLVPVELRSARELKLGSHRTALRRTGGRTGVYCPSCLGGAHGKKFHERKFHEQRRSLGHYSSVRLFAALELNASLDEYWQS